MKIFIVGASGRVGQKLANLLAEQGHDVLAASRHPQNFKNNKISSIEFDLHQDVDALTKVIGNVDAIYFVAGSRGHDLLQTDAFGPIKLAEVAKKNNIKRFVMLSSIFATEPEHWNDGDLSKITDYNIAKFFADEWFINNTDLDYTILQPGTLLEKPATGTTKLFADEVGSNSIDDVVTVLAGVLENNNSFKKVIRMHDGSEPIEDALRNI